MSGGERLIFDALTFRAVLWCCEENMLVRAAWSAAQSFPGRTFAWESQHALQQLGFPEVYSYDGWDEYMDRGTPVLPKSKAALKKVLEASSIAIWRSSFLASTA